VPVENERTDRSPPADESPRFSPLAVSGGSRSVAKRARNRRDVRRYQIRFRLTQLLQRIVAGEHGTGMNAAGVRGFDVVLHVADKKRFVRLEMVFGEDL